VALDDPTAQRKCSNQYTDIPQICSLLPNLWQLMGFVSLVEVLHKLI